MISELVDTSNHNISILTLDFSLLGVSDNKEIVAVEFFGGFDEGVEFAFAGFLGGHIVADLD